MRPSLAIPANARHPDLCPGELSMPMHRCLAGPWLLLTALASTVSAAAPPIRLELVESRKIWDRAPHNAFTDLKRFKDQWYLAFREGVSHGVVGKGQVRVLRSSDGRKWESVAVLKYEPDWDMRDAKLNVLPDGRLMLNTAAAPLANIQSRQSFAWFSPDGNDWSDGPHKVGQFNWWLWGVRVQPNGTIWGVGYGDLGNRPVHTRLYRSHDGLDYQVVLPTFTSAPHSGETALLFRRNGATIALVRAKDDSLVAVSRGDLTQWTFKRLPQQLGGPELIELPDGHILAGTRLYGGKVRTSVCLLDPEAGRMTELLALPSGGDASYPGLVWHDGLLWVSYYSSHEGRAAIYLAKVRVKP
jgi:hypothetical protein